MIEKNNEEAEKALRKELRENTFSTKRSVIIAFLLTVLFPFLAGATAFLVGDWLRNVFIILMFASFAYWGISVIATVAYITLDKMESTMPANFLIKGSKPLRIVDTKVFKFFIMKEFIDE